MELSWRTDQDLFRTVTYGIPGVMPSFGSVTEEERWQVIAYVQSLSPEFKRQTPQPPTIGGGPIPPTTVGIERGRELYQRFECQSYHGAGGGGDGPVALAGDIKDARWFRIPATDLTSPSSLRR